jgi:glycosyltransferase involved in cell wall biosynthesis
MLTTFYPPWSFGGDGIQVQRLARELAARGHEVTVVHSREGYATLTRGPAPAEADDDGVRVLGIDARTGPVSPVATYLTGRPVLARRSLERALEGPFDVLHFHNPSLLGGPGVLGMGDGLRLYTLHEHWLVCPTHVLWKYRRRVCERPTCWRCAFTYKRPPQPWRSTGLLDRAVAGLDALIAPSESTARLHARFAPLVRIERIPNFVPDAGLGGDDSGGTPYFLYVGRLEPIKGVDGLIEAFRRRPGARLVIAGSGSEEAALRRAAAGMENVEFAGWAEGDRLDSLYRGARAVVLPTRGHESFPLVLLEAFVRGRPAVVHRFGALAELAEESGGALTYSSPAELDAALDRFAADPGLAAQLGSAARAAYLERWTPDAHLRRYFDLIEELRPSLAAPRHPSPRSDAQAVETSAPESRRSP